MRVTMRVAVAATAAGVDGRRHWRGGPACVRIGRAECRVSSVRVLLRRQIDVSADGSYGVDLCAIVFTYEGGLPSGAWFGFIVVGAGDTEGVRALPGAVLLALFGGGAPMEEVVRAARSEVFVAAGPVPFSEGGLGAGARLVEESEAASWGLLLVRRLEPRLKRFRKADIKGGRRRARRWTA